MPSVGIDLGTTNSCVAVFASSGQVEVLTNEMGYRTTPSCVSFTGDTRLIGDAAKEHKKDNPEKAENTIFSVKRLIGRNFTDKTVVSDRNNWPFRVVNDHGRPKIRVEAENTTFHPEEISGMVLAEMKQTAEDRIGEKVFNAVVTVPAYFNDAQREATISAAKLANLNVLRILNEPTAAAIAYGAQKPFTSEGTVLVYDLGGGTFDITLLTIKGSDFKVIATGGDTNLGGDDFNQVLAEYLAKQFEGIHKISVMKDKVAMAILHEECEKRKINLSSQVLQRINIRALADGKDFKMDLTRATFENLNRDYFMKTFRLVESVLTDGNVKKSAIHDVLLVGGSTKIPFIREKLEEMFGKDKIRKPINQDEAVAHGAALYAAHLTGDTIPNIGEIRLQDVVPVALGTDVKGDLTSVIIKRNTKIPTTVEKVYETTADNQLVVPVNVYEGERAKSQDNHRLGGFDLRGIPPMPAGEAKVKVKFSIDNNGVLDVSAYETTTGKSGFISIESDRKRFTEREIRNLRQTAEKYRRSDDEIRQKVAARNNLETKICKVKRSTFSMKIHHKCEEIEKWIKNNQNAKKEDFIMKQRELEAFVSSN